MTWQIVPAYFFAEHSDVKVTITSSFLAFRTALHAPIKALTYSPWSVGLCKICSSHPFSAISVCKKRKRIGVVVSEVEQHIMAKVRK